MMENNTTTRQPVSAVSVDGTIHRHRTVVFLSNFRSCPALSAPISFNLHGFILNLDSYVEIDDLQTEIAITNKIVGFDVSMRNSVFMEICESLVGPQASRTRPAAPMAPFSSKDHWRAIEYTFGRINHSLVVEGMASMNEMM